MPNAANIPEDSILAFIKPTVNVPVEYTVFDNEIIMDINTAFSALYQIGFPSSPFRIHGYDEAWSDYLPDGEDEGDINIDEIKTYVRHRVKLMFDPPASNTLIELLERQCKEFESRVSYQVDDQKVK